MISFTTESSIVIYLSGITLTTELETTHRKENDMKAIICDICGKVMKDGNYTEYDIITVVESFVPYDVCKDCRDDVQKFVKSLIKERKGE